LIFYGIGIVVVPRSSPPPRTTPHSPIRVGGDILHNNFSDTRQSGREKGIMLKIAGEDVPPDNVTDGGGWWCRPRATYGRSGGGWGQLVVGGEGGRRRGPGGGRIMVCDYCGCGFMAGKM
jgi:hypothetical protein